MIESLERADITGNKVTESSRLQTESGEGHLTKIINTGGALAMAGKTITGGALLTKSTTLGEVLLAHKITGANIEMTDLNLAVQAKQEGNLQEIQQIQTAYVVE